MKVAFGSGNEIKITISAVDKATNKISGIKGAMSGLKSAASKLVIPLMAIGAGVAAGLGMAAKTFGDFEQSMANTASVANATSEELQAMTNYARQMGKESVFSATEAANAMYYLASAGYDAQEQMDSLKGVLDLASATQSDLAFTSETVAGTIKSFGLEAKDATRIADVFAATISASQATMPKLSTSMAYVGSIAAQMGWSVEETSAALGTLYNRGIDASMAGTALRKMISSLINPTESANEIFSALGENLGITTEEMAARLNPETNSLVDVIGTLGEAGMTTRQALEMFGQRAGPVMAALVAEGSKALEDLTEKAGRTGAASKMAETQINTFQGSMKLLKSAFEEVMISVGGSLAPYLKSFVDWLKTNLPGIVETFKEVFAIDTIVEGAKGILASFQDFMGRNKETIGELLESVGRIFGLIFESVTKAVQKLLDSGVMDLFILGITTIVSKLADFLEQNPWVIDAIVMIAGILILLASDVLAVVAAVGLLVGAWEYDLLGIRSIVEGFFSWIGSKLEAIASFIWGVIDAIKAVIEWFGRIASAPGVKEAMDIMGLIMGGPAGWGSALAGAFGFGDFIARPGMGIVPFDPQDTVIGVKDPSILAGLGGSTSTKTTTIYIENVNLASDYDVDDFKRRLAEDEEDDWAGRQNR